MQKHMHNLTSNPAHVAQPLLAEPASLQAAAGSARHRVAGVRTQRRRGSFLVLVVGTLALIAIITIVFVALGSQDSRTRSAVQARERFDEVPPQVADYIAGIVGRDAVATRTDIVSNAINDGSLAVPKQLVRETTDAPGTRYDVRSFVAAPSSESLRFNPEGTAPTDVDTIDLLGVPPSDPWLASSRPTAFEPNLASPQERRQTPDWAVITNIAPDGMPVNLVNLRNPAGGIFGITSREMREGTVPANAVSTRNDFVDPAVAIDRPAAFSMRQLGAFLPAAVGPNTDWSDPQMKLNQWADADGDGWLDSRWFEMRKQVADSDPQSDYVDVLNTSDRRTRYFFAARIIDLSGRVNVHTATDTMAGPSESYPLGLSPADVDLRRLLTNIDAVQDDNLSFDSLSPQWPVGTFVSGLVTGEQQVFLGSQAYIAARLSNVLGAPLPRRFGGVELSDDFATAIDVAPEIRVFTPATGVQIVPAQWFDFTTAWLDDDGSLQAVNSLAPKFAGPYNTNPNSATFGQEWRTFFPYSPGLSINLLAPRFDSAIDAAGRARLNAYAKAMGLTQGTALALPPGADPLAFGGPLRNSSGSSLPFGVPELAELLEREGVNSERTSALEAALGGRSTESGLFSIDPLRSTRPTSDELLVADFGSSPLGDIATSSAWDLRSLDVRSSLTTLSGARHIRPWRGRPTPPSVSPGSTERFFDPSALSEPEAKIDVVAQLTAPLYGNDVTLADLVGPDSTAVATSPDLYLTRERDPSVYRLFDGYAEALAPYSRLNGDSGLPNAWQYALTAGSPDIAADQLKTLFYGYRGPHVALQIAAHMATNLVDMVDSDDQPTVTTLEFVQNAVSDGLLASGDNGTNSTEPTLPIPVGANYPAAQDIEVSDLLPGYYALDQRDAAAGGIDNSEARRDPSAPTTAADVRIARQRLSRENDERLATTTDDVVNPVVNVYGLEPQVFLTQVASVTTYWDNDGLAVSNDTASEVHIDGSVTSTNGELLFRATIFQLSNPFDKPVKLSTAPYSEAMRAVPATPYGQAGWVNDPPRFVSATQSIENPGAYVPVADLVDRGYNASRLGSFYYIDVGDASVPSSLVSGLPRGKRFVLASLVEQTYVNTAPVDEVRPVDSSLVGQFARHDANPTAPAIVSMNEIVVQPGSTVTCVALSKPPSEIFRLLATRDPALASSVAGANVPEGDARTRIMRVLARHFSPRTDVSTPAGALFDPENTHWIPQIDPVTSDFLGFDDPAVAGFVDPVVPAPAAGSSGVQFATVWRTVRGAKERQGDSDPANQVFDGTNPWTEYFSIDGGASREPIANGLTNAAPGALQLIAPNNFQNDQMVDRMKLVTTSATSFDLDVRLPPRAVKVNNAFTTPPTPPVAGAQIVSDDELTLTLAAWVRRPAQNENFVIDIQRANGNLPNGILPAWAIEPKYVPRDQLWNAAYRTNLTSNVLTTVQPTTGDLDVSQFDATTAGPLVEANQNVIDWRREMDGTPSGGGPEEPLLTLPGRLPSTLTPQFIGENVLDPAALGVPAFAGAVTLLEPTALAEQIDVGARLSTMPAALNGTETLELSDTPVQLFVSQRSTSRETLSVLRLTDLLLPAGVGPFSAPFDKDGTLRSNSYSVSDAELSQYLARHTTLGEAVAEVMGYSQTAISDAASPTGYGAGDQDISTWFNGAPTSVDFQLPDTDSLTRNDETLFDGVHLALDRFTAFVDVNANGERDIGVGAPDPEPAALHESPLALSVLEQFVIAPPPLPERPAPTAAGALPRSPEIPARAVVNSLTKSQPGLININTANIDVLRTLPGVAPVFDTLGATVNEFDWTRRGTDFAFSTSPTPTLISPFQFGLETDLAPSLVAYRELGTGLIRTNTLLSNAWETTYAGVLGDASLNPSAADDETVRMIALPQDLRDDAALIATVPGPIGDPRRFTGVQQLQSLQEGGVDRSIFQSVGDVMSARLRQPGATEMRGIPTNPDYLASNIDFASPGGDSQDSSIARLSPFRASGAREDGVPNGYDEKLAIAAQFANTITTRSDTFAAWFVVHGYREEDVTNLSRTQAMVPSVQRRFLMVIDRSEVTRLNQKPDVLLFQEVPYEFPARR